MEPFVCLALRPDARVSLSLIRATLRHSSPPGLVDLAVSTKLLGQVRQASLRGGRDNEHRAGETPLQKLPSLTK
jgi:hypothetical protein